MTSNAIGSTHESEDSDSAEVFSNQFSDNDTEEESMNEHAIVNVRKTNIIKPNFRPNFTATVTRVNFQSFKTNSYNKADDKNVPSDTCVDDYRDDLFRDTNSETSGTDSDDDSTSSGDFDAENWKPDPKSQRSYRNKNVILLGSNSGVAKHQKHVFSPEQVKEFPTKTKYSAPYNHSDHQSNFKTNFSTHASENFVSVSDEDHPRMQRCNKSHKPAKDVDEIKSSFSAASNRPVQVLKPEHTKFPTNATVEKLIDCHVTGPQFGRNASGSGSHQSNGQSSTFVNSVFWSWNENWTTDDYLICPNFLLGAPNVENSFSTKKAGHATDRYVTPIYRTDRIPRMFHRRVNKDARVDPSRDERFSNLPSNMNNPLVEIFKIVKEMRIDVTKFLEQADRLEMPLQFPCMQCHEGSTMSEIASDLMSGSEYSPDGRCKRCGGQLQTFASLGTMITKLRDTVAKNNFEIRDVYPDGNCVFGTVIDQLRVRGDFRYTVHTLRAAVVNYLRENPKAEDGTPLEMFLTNETWDEYLKRMSEDGQWGDHMVLNAMTNVLQVRIIIFGGRDGETETILIPKIPEKDSTKAATSELADFKTIYMGHLGETHYVSFRPENWWHAIQEENFRTQIEWEHRKFDPVRNLYVPVKHLDFVLRYTIKLEHISYLLPALADIPNDDQGSECTVTLVGPIMCKMAPDYTSQVESMAPDISVFFPDSFYKGLSSTSALSVFQTPRDTCIQENMSEPKPVNLLTEKSSSDLSHIRLLPVKTSLWQGQTIESSAGAIYLKAIDLESIPFETFFNSIANEQLTMHRTLAFKSGWPEVASDWIFRERKSGKPEEFIIQSVASIGCHVVPIIRNESLSNVVDSFITDEMIDGQDLWSYSFAVAETMLSRYISHGQRCCFLLLKSLLDFTCSDPILPTALPKSVFFYACENIEEETWCRMPGRCILIMLEKLTVGLRMNFVPHYFISAQNLLQNIPSDQIEIWANYIEGTLKQPVVSLYYVLDMLDITSSEIGEVFDDIIEDLPKFNTHISIERSFNETHVPASGKLIENLIYQREYDFAMISLDDIHEQIRQFIKQPVSIAKVMNMVIPSMPIGYKWCLGLYIDLMRGTAITREIGSSVEAVHITEVFGPDIDDEEISNTVVPAIYSIALGDLKFPSVCAEVMLKAGRKTLLAKCLRYFIDTYSEIAGDNIVISQHTYTQYPLKSLQGIYMTLLETYDDLGCVGEFRKLMDNLSMITQLRQVHFGFHDLAKAWEKLGEPEQAMKVCPCYYRHKDGFLKGMLQEIFGRKKGYDY